jgi:hypothetical protein
LGAIKPKGLNRITKTDQGHQCLREENLNRPRSPMPEGGEPIVLSIFTLFKNCKFQ